MLISSARSIACSLIQKRNSCLTLALPAVLDDLCEDRECDFLWRDGIYGETGWRVDAGKAVGVGLQLLGECLEFAMAGDKADVIRPAGERRVQRRKIA